MIPNDTFFLCGIFSLCEHQGIFIKHLNLQEQIWQQLELPGAIFSGSSVGRPSKDQGGGQISGIFRSC